MSKSNFLFTEQCKSAVAAINRGEEKVEMEVSIEGTMKSVVVVGDVPNVGIKSLMGTHDLVLVVKPDKQYFIGTKRYIKKDVKPHISGMFLPKNPMADVSDEDLLEEVGAIEAKLSKLSQSKRKSYLAEFQYRFEECPESEAPKRASSFQEMEELRIRKGLPPIDRRQ